MYSVILPELGEGIEEAILAEWHIQVGDSVQADDDIAEVVTDKATFNVPAGATGIVKKLCATKDEKVKVGSPLAVIEPVA